MVLQIISQKMFYCQKQSSIVETSSSLCRYLTKNEIVFSVRKKSSPVFYDTTQPPSLSSPPPPSPLLIAPWRRRQRGKGCPKRMQRLTGGRQHGEACPCPKKPYSYLVPSTHRLFSSSSTVLPTLQNNNLLNREPIPFFIHFDKNVFFVPRQGYFQNVFGAKIQRKKIIFYGDRKNSFCPFPSRLAWQMTVIS